ncbi:MAG: hypothetical protein A3K67_06565 [Euryarchaeota archaeon RBG_16_62_10]|nr:MAG: hypothetical protein A3K67_06565 [Euryarchaeota archaeon RBG_16_62_10]
MPIKSFELISIDAKRFSKMGERIPHLRVDHNTAVTSITPLTDKDAQVDFRFTVNYVGVGLIKIEGRVVWDGEAKALSTQWAQTNALPNEVFNPILSAIFANCMPAAVVCARDLGLPPPLPPPQIQQAKPAKGPGARDAKGSMEVA